VRDAGKVWDAESLVDLAALVDEVGDTSNRDG
jgi:hypothetical protein